MTSHENSPFTFFQRHPNFFVCLLLILITLALYFQVKDHEFLNFDDNWCVLENFKVRPGITLEGIKWSFSLYKAIQSHWHPLTWFSHMLDCQIFGLNPGMHHLTNLLFHMANALLLFLFLERVTRARWSSAFVAMVFALHPINVDSVAWITNRKTLLSAFFWMLTLLAYVRYAKRPSIQRYVLVLVVFALGLMAKPVLVTLPFALLLLDYWPFQRLCLNNRAGFIKEKAPNEIYQRTRPYHLVLEKIPLLALSGVLIYLSSTTLKHAGSIITTDVIPMQLRIENALVSYVKYMGKMIWPQNLAVYYPYPSEVPMWQVVGACIILVIITFFVIRKLNAMPYLAVGWFWYLGTLIPVLGFTQAGLWPAMADRFAYVPLIGLFIMIAWGVPELLKAWRYKRTALPVLSGLVLFSFIICSWFQIKHWKNSVTLFQHAVNVTDNNYTAHTYLGHGLFSERRPERAIEHFRRALQIKPSDYTAHTLLGDALAHEGRLDEAFDHLSEALRINPDYAEAHYYLGLVLEKKGDLEKAIDEYGRALYLQPHLLKVMNNLGSALIRKGDFEKAVFYLTEAVRFNPDYATAHYNLGVARLGQKKVREAIYHFSEAVRINPGYTKAHEALRHLEKMLGTP
jgi:Flp pilus assembly protein TadD